MMKAWVVSSLCLAVLVLASSSDSRLTAADSLPTAKPVFVSPTQGEVVQVERQLVVRVIVHKWQADTFTAVFQLNDAHIAEQAAQPSMEWTVEVGEGFYALTVKLLRVEGDAWTEFAEAEVFVSVHVPLPTRAQFRADGELRDQLHCDTLEATRLAIDKPSRTSFHLHSLPWRDHSERSTCELLTALRRTKNSLTPDDRYMRARLGSSLFYLGHLNAAVHNLAVAATGRSTLLFQRDRLHACLLASSAAPTAAAAAAAAAAADSVECVTIMEHALASVLAAAELGLVFLEKASHADPAITGPSQAAARAIAMRYMAQAAQQYDTMLHMVWQTSQPQSALSAMVMESYVAHRAAETNFYLGALHAGDIPQVVALVGNVTQRDLFGHRLRRRDSRGATTPLWRKLVAWDNATAVRQAVTRAERRASSGSSSKMKAAVDEGSRSSGNVSLWVARHNGQPPRATSPARRQYSAAVVHLQRYLDLLPMAVTVNETAGEEAADGEAEGEEDAVQGAGQEATQQEALAIQVAADAGAWEVAAGSKEEGSGKGQVKPNPFDAHMQLGMLMATLPKRLQLLELESDRLLSQLLLPCDLREALSAHVGEGGGHGGDAAQLVARTRQQAAARREALSPLHHVRPAVRAADAVAARHFVAAASLRPTERLPYRFLDRFLQHRLQSTTEEALDVFTFGAQHGVYNSRWQRPYKYVVTELPSEPWHDKSKFWFATQLKRRFQDIRNEGLAALAVSVNARRVASSVLPAPEHHFACDHEGGEAKWFKLVLTRHGQRYSNNMDRCPETSDMLESIAEAYSCVVGVARFDLLLPGAYLPPHSSATNAKLRMLLPLSVGEPIPGLRHTQRERHARDAGSRSSVLVRVGGAKAQAWREGVPMFFDDSFEHEVWHNGSYPALAFVMDVWHPEVTNDERAGAAAAVGVERELVERLQQVDAMGELVEWRREEAQAGARGRGRGGRAPGEVRV